MCNALRIINCALIHRQLHLICLPLLEPLQFVLQFQNESDDGTFVRSQIKQLSQTVYTSEARSPVRESFLIYHERVLVPVEVVTTGFGIEFDLFQVFTRTIGKIICEPLLVYQRPFRST